MAAGVTSGWTPDQDQVSTEMIFDRYRLMHNDPPVEQQTDPDERTTDRPFGVFHCVFGFDLVSFLFLHLTCVRRIDGMAPVKVIDGTPVGSWPFFGLFSSILQSFMAPSTIVID